jgi:hypothetical protein
MTDPRQNVRGGAWSLYSVSDGDRAEASARLVARASGTLLEYNIDASQLVRGVVRHGFPP